MAHPVPPHMQQALQALQEAVKQRSPQVDLLSSPWAEVEKAIIPFLGGPFEVQNPQHQFVAMGLSAAFGERMARELGAFWAMNREVPTGVVLGFPEALIMLSPFSAVAESLAMAKLPRLEEVEKEIRQALAQVKLGLNQPAGGARLTPADYERLLDPAFLEFVRFDEAKLKTFWDMPVADLAKDLRDAIQRSSSQVPAQLLKQFEAQVLGALQQLDPKKSLLAQAEMAPRMLELMAFLFAGTELTRPAPEDFWGAVAFPLLFIGAPANFPPLDEEERALVKQGVNPLSLYLDVVPFQTPAPEEGLLGAFEANEVQPPHPQLSHDAPLRLLFLTGQSIEAPLASFDPAKSQDAFKRFIAYVEKETGSKVDGAGMLPHLEQATQLLSDLKRIFEAKSRGPLALRRLTEGEASTDAALEPLRKALQGSRIILI